MLVMIGLGLWLAVKGVLARSIFKVAAGTGLAVGTAVFFWFLGFWGEMLWFEDLGYGERFWMVFWVRPLGGTVGAVIAAGIVYLLTLGYTVEKRMLRLGAVIISALVGLNWGVSNWENILRFTYAVPTELRDPIWGKTVGFYLFILPLLDAVENLLLLVAIIGIAATVVDGFLTLHNGQSIEVQPRIDERRIGAVYRAVGILFAVLAYAMLLKCFHLLYSNLGVITGPGWTDVHIRFPAIITMLVVITAVAVIMFIPFLRLFFLRQFGSKKQPKKLRHVAFFATAGIVVFGLQALFLFVVPAAFQRLRVEPNEITFEKSYIANNIKFNRHGFNLDGVEEKEYPVNKRFSPDMVEKNRAIFSNIRLWDWRALDAVIKQFQEIRLYYEFQDVDVDRYMIDGDYRQVMISAREMELDNLPAQSQTFVNRRFKFTHGYGIVMTNVSEFTDQGLPNLLIRDIPPKSRYEDITVARPEIYYGELTRSAALVNTREKEFDYPKGEGNAYNRYSGKGGVELKNIGRRFVYSRKFDGLPLLLSDYPTKESRIMFHRQIEKRVNLLAPFLNFDDDPYIVLADGKLYWIVDAYTTTNYYPYSERFVAKRGNGISNNQLGKYDERKLGRFRDSNYVRNSVKVVMDAFNGSVDFFVFDKNDPLIGTWQCIFPDMFKKAEEMPATLRQHIRYPIDMLLLQGLVYAKYHMTDPAVFYNQEDLWVRATEKYYDKIQPVEPYYIMWKLPEFDHPEFVLMLPFTPKNRQVSIGWIAGMCDGTNYGKFLAYKFPKEKLVLGPQQMETKIDQDRFLSGQLTLWDQRGSRVIRGNVLAIPLEKTLLYVEPIYLQAETAAYPELRLFALMQDDRLSYAATFEEALQGLFVESKKTASKNYPGDIVSLSVKELISSANKAFINYLSAMGDKQFQDASESLQRLESLLQELSRQSAEKKK